MCADSSSCTTMFDIACNHCYAQRVHRRTLLNLHHQMSCRWCRLFIAAVIKRQNRQTDRRTVRRAVPMPPLPLGAQKERLWHNQSVTLRQSAVWSLDRTRKIKYYWSRRNRLSSIDHCFNPVINTVLFCRHLIPFATTVAQTLGCRNKKHIWWCGTSSHRTTLVWICLK